VQLSYENGEFRFQYGPTAPQLAGISEEQLIKRMEEIQRENLILMNQMIRDSESRLRNEYIMGITQVVREIERQRNYDLRLVGEGFQILHTATEGRLAETNQLLDNLLRIYSLQYEAASRLEKIQKDEDVK
ncbi:MAG: hypothetical protein ACE5QV_09710, partial [Fidelibacterota bacterium]